MVLTNPWLAGPTPTARLPREQLEERIRNLLSSQNMCRPDGAAATPVRYFHLGFTIVFSTSRGSSKVRNLAQDPRASVGVFAPLVGLASSRGAQVFGRARVLSPGDAEHVRFLDAGRWQGEHVEQGLDVTVPPALTLVVVDADRIVHTEHWLRRSGYAPRQHWRR